MKQAVVQAKLKDEVYVRLPLGCGDHSRKVVRLNKILYGLRRASGEFHIPTNFVKGFVDRFNVSRTSPIPASSSVDLRKVDGDDVVEGISFREVVGSLM